MRRRSPTLSGSALRFWLARVAVAPCPGDSVSAMKTRRTLIAIALLACTAGACSKSGGSASSGGGSKINKASIGKAQDLLKPPLPVADAKAKVAELLGEPTAVDGEDIFWAAVDGDQCYQLKLMVQGGEVKGASGGSVNKMVEESFTKCAAHAAPAK
jgi:hypothetical protein